MKNSNASLFNPFIIIHPTDTYNIIHAIIIHTNVNHGWVYMQTASHIKLPILLLLLRLQLPRGVCVK